MIRHRDWLDRLHAYLQAIASESFEFGRFDCCLFACDAIHAMTGSDLAAPFRGRYHSRATARAAFINYVGQASLTRAVERATAEHGAREVHPLCACRGDLVLIPRAPEHEFPSLGVVAPTGYQLLVVSDPGYLMIPFASASRAWKI